MVFTGVLGPYVEHIPWSKALTHRNPEIQYQAQEMRRVLLGENSYNYPAVTRWRVEMIVRKWRPLRSLYLLQDGAQNEGDETGGPPAFALLAHADFPDSCVPCDNVFFLHRAVLEFLSRHDFHYLRRMFFEMGIFTHEDLVTIALEMRSEKFRRMFTCALLLEPADDERLKSAFMRYASPLLLPPGTLSEIHRRRRDNGIEEDWIPFALDPDIPLLKFYARAGLFPNGADHGIWFREPYLAGLWRVSLGGHDMTTFAGPPPNYKPRRHAQKSLEEYLRSERPVYTFCGPLQREPVHAITRDYFSDEVPVELHIRQPLLGAIARLEGDWLVPALQDSGIINEEDIKVIRSHLHHAGFRKLLRRALGVNSKDTNWYRILQLFGWPEAAPPEEWQTSHPIRDRMEDLMEKHPSVRKVFESFARFDAVRSEALSASYSDLMCAFLSTAMMDS
ncbi:hypothetical protein BDZ89DRAFT_1148762 [Hymenopellis radicata]|nr:hypothetical protein BDZ89DRAFT_1148762 [Hymenopellis radicata]